MPNARIEKATDELSKLPAIGKKSARRIVNYLLKKDFEFVKSLADSLIDLKLKVKTCSICYNYSEEEICEICADNKRDHSTICVVEEASDIEVIEKTNEYKGVYHVLGGALSPLNGVGVENLRIKELLQRINNTQTKEIIIALNPDAEGDATSIYLSERIKENYPNIKITRIARGIPLGGTLEYIDQATLAKALVNRNEF
jgi:recombination protein RecR